MRYETIVAFLSGDLLPESLAAEIEVEVATHRMELKASAAGYVHAAKGPDFVVDRSGARRLLHALDRGQLSFNAATYIADCLTMSEPFEFADDATRDAIFFLEDDTPRFVSGNEDWQPSRDEILQALAALD